MSNQRADEQNPQILDISRGAFKIQPARFPLKETAAVRRFLTRENVFALALCLVLILLVIVTADAGPSWIYQSF